MSRRDYRDGINGRGDSAAVGSKWPPARGPTADCRSACNAAGAAVRCCRVLREADRGGGTAPAPCDASRRSTAPSAPDHTANVCRPTDPCRSHGVTPGDLRRPPATSSDRDQPEQRPKRRPRQPLTASDRSRQPPTASTYLTFATSYRRFTAPMAFIFDEIRSSCVLVAEVGNGWNGPKLQLPTPASAVKRPRHKAA